MLQVLNLTGFRSIKEQTFDLRPLNVLIGTNGAGKSNLVSFFQMLAFLRTGALQEYIGRNGSAESLLYYGAATTPVLTFQVEFEVQSGRTAYASRLAHAAGDTLIFVEERVGYRREPGEWRWENLGAGHKESRLEEVADTGNQTARTVRWNLQRCNVYHFHDTSPASRIRNKGYIEDNRYLRSDAGNLAAYLLRLQLQVPDAYSRIVRTIQQILPFFGGFELAPTALDPQSILLNWRERGRDYLFGPHHLSDGALRTMALVTTLVQPQEQQPVLIVLDEPELGLHPYAVAVIAGLMRSASHQTQVVASTQSITLLDQFEPGDVVVVERGENGSAFKRLDNASLQSWLTDYSLGELWEKNVIGGRPTR